MITIFREAYFVSVQDDSSNDLGVKSECLVIKSCGWLCDNTLILFCLNISKILKKKLVKGLSLAKNP